MSEETEEQQEVMLNAEEITFANLSETERKGQKTFTQKFFLA